MSVERLLSQFDLTLSQDVVKGVQTTGVPFTRKIWGEGTGKRDLVGCIILDKSDKDVVHLKFNVYNKEDQDGESKNSQTDHSGALQEKNETSESSVQAQQQTDAKNSQTEVKEHSEQYQQTEKLAVGERYVQTEKEKLEESFMQTDELEQLEQTTQTEQSANSLNESCMQTEEFEQFDQTSQTVQAVLTESFIQTEPPSTSVQCLQTEPPRGHHKQIQVLWQSKTTKTQTDIKKMQETPAQTELIVREQKSQTEPTPLSDGEVQACVQVSENTAQTEIKEFVDTTMQTEVKVHQKGIQTLKPQVKHRTALTDPMIVIDPEEQLEMDAQTDPMRVIDPSLDREAATQTEYGKVIYPEIMFDNVCQTDDVKVVTIETQAEGVSQTDYVFITQPEDLMENVVQTDDVTILNPDTQISQETQTNLVWVVGLQQDENADKDVDAPVITPTSSVQVEPAAPVLGQEPPMIEPPTLDMSVQPMIPDEISAIKGPVDNEEKWVQTDPVTIIIGDSSFLLQQLANINKSPEASPQQIPPRRKPGRPSGTNSIYNRNRQDNPPMLERQGHEGAIHLGQENVAADGIMTSEMPTLEAEGGQARRGVKMLLPKQRNPYRGPYSVSGMKPTSQQQTPSATPGSQVLDASQQHVQEMNTAPVRIASDYHEQQVQGDFQSEQQQQQDLEDQGPKGKFNCPFCTATFDDTPQLYKHIHEDHGTPRCSTRKARRKGTIIVDDDGSMHIVGEQNTLWELNEENIKRYRRAKRYSPRSSRYTPRSSITPKEEAGLFRDEEGEVPLSQSLVGETSGIVGLQERGLEEGEVTLQIVQNGSNTQPIVKQTGAVHIPEAATDDITSEAVDAGKRAFNCPRCPRLFTKSSELYIHLQNSHKTAGSGRGRGRGRGAYHHLQIVDATDLQEQELVEGQPPAVIQLQQQQDLSGEVPEEQHPEDEQEVEIRVEYRDETVDQQQQSEQDEELPMAAPVSEERDEGVAQEEAEEELPAIKVTRRGRPKIKKEKDEGEHKQDTKSPRGGKRKVEEDQEEAGLVVAEEEQPRRGRSAGSGESPPKRTAGRPPSKRGRRH